MKKTFNETDFYFMANQGAINYIFQLKENAKNANEEKDLRGQYETSKLKSPITSSLVSTTTNAHKK